MLRPMSCSGLRWADDDDDDASHFFLWVRGPTEITQGHCLARGLLGRSQRSGRCQKGQAASVVGFFGASLLTAE